MRACAQSIANVGYYEGTYPDLMNVYGDNHAAAAAHWARWGLRDGRRASPIFDPQYYLEHNPDLLARFGPHGYEAAARHFIRQGLPREGRRGSLEFDPKYYLAHNPDLLARFGPRGYVAAARHFLLWGLPVEGRQGSADFAVRDYIRDYPDVLAAYGPRGYEDAMMHWMRVGKWWGRLGTGSTFGPSRDCTSSDPPNGYSRVYIAARSDGLPGSGSLDDPFDGSSAQKFDSILRGYSGDPASGIPAADHLIVCIGPGTFETEGAYDFVPNVPHSSPANPNGDRGFALGPFWHVHGAGTSQTTLRLASYFVPAPGDPANAYLQEGAGVVFSTVSDAAQGIEISDLTIDDNYPALKQIGGARPLNLEAIHLRSDLGGHWIHNVNVMHSSGEIYEAFPIELFSVNNTSPVTNRGNLIEFVTMSGWGGGSCTAIAVANALAEVRFNVVNGLEKGFGGWQMPAVWFHNNFAINTDYGFNIDSLANDGVIIEFNQIIAPRRYGIVVGGTGSYRNFILRYNTISPARGAIGLLFHGHVRSALVSRTDFIGRASDRAAIRLLGPGNTGNSFEFNQVSDSLSIALSSQRGRGGNCVYANWDQDGRGRWDFPNTQNRPCAPNQ